MICPICKCEDCDDDCVELSTIYRNHQREQLKDIELDPSEICSICKGYLPKDGCNCHLP